MRLLTWLSWISITLLSISAVVYLGFAWYVKQQLNLPSSYPLVETLPEPYQTTNIPPLPAASPLGDTAPG